MKLINMVLLALTVLTGVAMGTATRGVLSGWDYILVLTWGGLAYWTGWTLGRTR